jgi:6-pyruvoyltetrahydropterin/6-carboxytetrahydropterin synthase
MEIFKTFTFDAAHRLPMVPETHSCSGVHGHTYSVTVLLSGEVDRRSGWVMDFKLLSRACTPLMEMLDHSFLNELPGLENPTSENLAIWLWDRLLPELPMLYMIEVRETPTSGCRYFG